jgi:L-malate glycosyltransferase
MKNEKHILFISSWYPNRSNPTHGIFNLYFARAASLYTKVSVIHVCSEVHLKADFETEITEENNITTIQLYYKRVTTCFPLISQFIKKKRVTAAFDKAYDLLESKLGRPDLIQINVILPMGIGAYHLAQKHQLPYVVNENWSGYCEEDGNYKGLIKKYYTKKIVAGASALMPTSHFLRKAMQGHHLNGDYHVVPNVVDVAVFKPFNTTTVSRSNFIHISSLNDKEKNVSGILRAFAKAFEVNKNIELTIVGEGSDRKLYEDLVDQLNLRSHVTFKGRLLSDHLVKEINESIALIMFSNYETFCLVIIEAFACGKPVITSNAGAIPDYMKPELGIMVNKNNESELTQAILKMAKEHTVYQKNQIREFAIKNYSYEQVGAELKRIYDFVLTKKNIK